MTYEFINKVANLQVNLCKMRSGHLHVCKGLEKTVNFSLSLLFIFLVKFLDRKRLEKTPMSSFTLAFCAFWKTADAKIRNSTSHPYLPLLVWMGASGECLRLPLFTNRPIVSHSLNMRKCSSTFSWSQQ